MTRKEPTANYNQFIAELTKLSRKYGVAIESVGGIFLAEKPADFSELTYDADISSGDLLPKFRG